MMCVFLESEIQCPTSDAVGPIRLTDKRARDAAAELWQIYGSPRTKGHSAIIRMPH
jgi:hypothetical protein